MSDVTEQLREAPAVPAIPPARRGPNPVVALAAAFVVGLLLARLIDWRSHAHPRR